MADLRRQTELAAVPLRRSWILSFSGKPSHNSQQYSMSYLRVAKFANMGDMVGFFTEFPQLWSPMDNDFIQANIILCDSTIPEAKWENIHNGCTVVIVPNLAGCFGSSHGANGGNHQPRYETLEKELTNCPDKDAIEYHKRMMNKIHQLLISLLVGGQFASYLEDAMECSEYKDTVVTYFFKAKASSAKIELWLRDVNAGRFIVKYIEDLLKMEDPESSTDSGRTSRMFNISMLSISDLLKNSRSKDLSSIRSAGSRSRNSSKRSTTGRGNESRGGSRMSPSNGSGRGREQNTFKVAEAHGRD